jgi:hypothetical protein
MALERRRDRTCPLWSFPRKTQAQSGAMAVLPGVALAILAGSLRPYLACRAIRQRRITQARE